MTRRSTKGKLLIVYVLSVHSFLIFVLVESDYATRVAQRMGLTGSRQEITGHYEEMLIHHARMDSHIPDGAAIFIGDSFIEGLCVSAVMNSSVNYGIGGDTTAGVIKRLPLYRSLDRAKLCVVAIGINDLKRRGNEEILKNDSLILQRIPPHVPVIFSAVMPVNENIRKDRMNARIQALNKELKKLCAVQKRRIVFSDPGGDLSDPAGNLRQEYCEADGLHLNRAGYEIWMKNLESAVRELGL